MTIGALECAAACGAAPEVRSEIEDATGAARAAGGGLGARTRSPTRRPRRSRGSLDGTVPVIHGAGPTAAVARRWATQLQRERQDGRVRLRAPRGGPQPGLRLGARPPAWPRSSAVFLEDPDHHPRVRKRVDLTVEEVERAGAPAVRVGSRGESRLERVLSLVSAGGPRERLHGGARAASIPRPPRPWTG